MPMGAGRSPGARSFDSYDATPPGGGFFKGSNMRKLQTLIALALVVCATTSVADVLPSWKEGTSRAAIINFVARVTEPGSADFVPADERIAVFDNDGNLWAEKPVYFQLLFAIDRVRELVPQHPEWKEKQPFKAVSKSRSASPG